MGLTRIPKKQTGKTTGGTYWDAFWTCGMVISLLFLGSTLYQRELHKQTMKEFEYIDSLLIRIEKVDSIHLNWSIDKLR